MSANAHVIISCEAGRDFVPVPTFRPGEDEVVAALTSLPSVGRSRARATVRGGGLVSPGAASLIALVGSISTAAFGYLVYALFLPVH